MTNREYNFNTSHVTVYLVHKSIKHGNATISIHLMLLFIIFLAYNQLFDIVISIHLMLLFIVTRTKGQPMVLAFQYISCYCLSNELTPFYIFLRI